VPLASSPAMIALTAPNANFIKTSPWIAAAFCPDSHG
jgi:hypothetical protein